jgi:hypothetical protein
MPRVRPLRARALFALAAFAAASIATLAASRADAFCGFYVAPGDKPLYNDASTVALMREGNTTVMSMSNNYKGPTEDFAMVVPVPVVLAKENVKTLDREVFKRLEELTAPRLVEYWEKDPCDHPCADTKPGEGCGYGSGMGYGGGSGRMGVGSNSTVVLAEFAVGEYEIVILGATDSDDLEKWLVAHKYKIPSGAAAALAPYIHDQMKFFVAKVNAAKVTKDAQGVVVLSPLRLQYEAQEFRLPVRLGLLNAAAKQDLIVYVLSKGSRYEVANYPNVFIPTNLEVRADVRNAFSPFYASLFDAALEKAGGKAVVTEYAWSTGSCDPCPTPPLSDKELASLGGDVAFGTSGTVAGKPASGLRRGTSLEITRLHTRYDAKTLSDDLFFRAAEPVEGGREDPDAKGVLPKTAKSSSSNNFQARYVIRNAWTGPIACRNPLRGEWGDAPGGSRTPPPPSKATGLAGAQRGLSLASYLKEPFPELNVVAAGAAPTPDAGVSDAGATGGDASAGSGAVPSVTPSSGHGCGCETAGARGEGAPRSERTLGALAMLGLVAATARRQASRTSRTA